MAKKPPLGPRKSPRSKPLSGLSEKENIMRERLIFQACSGDGDATDLSSLLPPSLTISWHLRFHPTRYQGGGPAVIFQPTLGPLGDAGDLATLLSRETRVIFQPCSPYPHPRRCTGRRPLADALYTSTAVPGAREV